jgi:hypothetical protein
MTVTNQFLARLNLTWIKLKNIFTCLSKMETATVVLDLAVEGDD